MGIPFNEATVMQSVIKDQVSSSLVSASRRLGARRNNDCFEDLGLKCVISTHMPFAGTKYMAPRSLGHCSDLFQPTTVYYGRGQPVVLLYPSSGTILPTEDIATSSPPPSQARQLKFTSP